MVLFYELYEFLELGSWGLDPASWGMFCLTGALVGFSKTGLPGVTILTVPLMASLFPPKISVGVLLPLLMAGDVLSTLRYWRQARWHYCFPYLLFVGGGIAVASFVAGWVDSRVFSVLIGWTVLFLLGMNVFADYLKRRQLSCPPSARPPLVVSASFGLAVGFFSALANAAGPLMTLYMIVSRLNKYEFLG
ncbi:MAG: sulfite exporter TauE/SafE family protein, partial [Fretibacterium sp.]|nr:sulfite exporter TauE/SafE family protein [Fretibacterium sp.]